MTIIGYKQVTKALKRIDQQRRSGCFLHIPDDRQAYARRCMSVIVAGTAAQDASDKIQYQDAAA